MSDDESVRPVLVPEDEWDDDEDWGDWGGWKASDNSGWNDEEYEFGGCEDDDAPPVPLTKRVGQGGSSSKWKPEEFAGIVERVAPTFSQEKALGLIDGNDSVIMHVNNDQAIVFTIDWFTPVVDDYYQFGAISAASALAGLYATGVRPITALNVMALPCKLGVDTVGDVVRGRSDKVVEAGAFVVGGHSIDDDTPKYGLATFGFAPADTIIRNENVAPGDVLFYTKPLGSGIMTQAYREELETEESLQDTVDSMMELCKGASEAMKGLDVHGAVVVGSQGLVGHVHELLETCGAAASLQWDNMVLLERAWDHYCAGCRPERTAETLAWARGFVVNEGASAEDFENRLGVLCDPQTSGGLIVAVAPGQADAYAEAFGRMMDRPPARIGCVQEGETGSIVLS